MRYLMLILLSFIFLSNESIAQEKVSKKESKAIVKELDQDQKMRLLAKLIKQDEKILDKTLTKLLRKADKAEVDKFMGKKDMVFKPMQKDATSTKTAGSTMKTVQKTKARSVDKVEKKVIKAEEKQEIEVKPPSVSEKEKQVTTESKPKPSFVFKDKSAGPVAEIKWDEMVFDYGTITDGESVTHTYKFTNEGDVPYIISNAKGSCGCTVPKWPTQPIPPGGTGEIIVTFNSRGKGRPEGANQNKRVTITGNTNPAQTYLSIKGIVKK